MHIEVQRRHNKPPRAFTHAVAVDGVLVGYGSERSMARAAKVLEEDQKLAREMMDEFRHASIEW